MTELRRAAFVALGLVLFLESIRVWMPSVLLVYGRAGTTPATEMGAFAAVPFLLGVLGVILTRLAPRWAVFAPAVLLAAGRLVAQGTAGGDPQLWASTAAVLGGVLWLIGVAGRGVPPATAPVGVVGGMALDALLHGALGSADLVWRTGPLVWLVVIAMVALFVWLAWRDGAGAGEPAAGWYLVGPALAIHGMLTALVSRLATLTGWSEPGAFTLLAAAHVLAVGAVVVVTRSGGGAASATARRVAAWAAGVLLLTGFAGAWGGPAWAVAAGHVALTVGLAVTLAAAVAVTSRRSVAARSVGAWAGLLLFFAVAFLYYGRYDMALGPPGPGPGILIAALVPLALAALLVRPARTPAPSAAPAVAAALALLLGVPAAVLASAAPSAEPGGYPLRIMSYNMQFGYDIDGHYNFDPVVEAIRAEQPDIVALQEVSRGWLVNGGIDVLTPLATRLGMQAVFQPASDEVWGNAILTRLPILDTEVGFLPRLEAPQRRSYIAAVVDVGGSELAVVATHVSHTDEEAALRAEQVAFLDRVVRRLAEHSPVAVVGDLNAEPGAAELAPFEAWLQNPVDGQPTWPSWGPDRAIDYVLLTPDLDSRDVSVGTSTASDHVSVAVTVTPR